MITKKLGIWMDHASAHLMEYADGSFKTSIISSKFTHQQKTAAQDKSENLMHNKGQHEQSTYYKQLGEVIKNYDEVLLFGATIAKNELYNILSADHAFEKISIETKTTDRLTEYQRESFVLHYFSGHLVPQG